MLRHVGIVRSDVSKERSAYIISVARIGELGMLAVTTMRRLLVTTNVVASSLILVTLMEAIRSSETSVLTRATWHNISEGSILHIQQFGILIRSVLSK
jgi:hypothetical protein